MIRKIYPFHPSKVPFDYRKHYNINDHDAYVKHLISSSFTTLKNQQKQSIPIGLINTKTLPNVMSGAIDFVAKLLSLSKGNAIEHLYLKTNKSIELLIY